MGHGTGQSRGREGEGDHECGGCFAGGQCRPGPGWVQDEQEDRFEGYVHVLLIFSALADSVALEEAMDLSDGDALSRLYGFSVDVQVFGEFVECLKTHIEV